MIRETIVNGLLSFSLAFTAIVVKGQHVARVEQSDLPRVSLCELVRNPQLYDKRVVHLKAIYAVSYEWVLLYDCECRKRESYLYPVIAGDTDESS